MKRIWIALAVVVALAGAGIGVLAMGPPQASPEAIETSVTREPELLSQANALPVAATIAPGLAFQSNPSLCGPASLANVLRSLGEEEQTAAQVLDGSGLCWTGYCIMGLTLDELAGLAQSRTERKVSVLRGLTLDEFRDHMRHANDPDRRYVINFSRKPIFGAGAGHHSPIGGYLADRDLVYVLDVNRAYGPWLIETDRLFAAMDTLDGDAKRGLLLIQ